MRTHTHVTAGGQPPNVDPICIICGLSKHGRSTCHRLAGVVWVKCTAFGIIFLWLMIKHKSSISTF